MGTFQALFLASLVLLSLVIAAIMLALWSSGRRGG